MHQLVNGLADSQIKISMRYDSRFAIPVNPDRLYTTNGLSLSPLSRHLWYHAGAINITQRLIAPLSIVCLAMLLRLSAAFLCFQSCHLIPVKQDEPCWDLLMAASTAMSALIIALFFAAQRCFFEIGGIRLMASNRDF